MVNPRLHNYIGMQPTTGLQPIIHGIMQWRQPPSVLATILTTKALPQRLFNRVLTHWITNYKIDGYRFDFSKGLTQKHSTDDASFSAYDASRIAIIKGYAATIRAAKANAYIILEHFCANAEEKNYQTITG